MIQQQLEAVRLIVKNYDVDGIRHNHDGSVVSYYGGVLYDYSDGRFCIVDRKISNYISGLWYYSIFDEPSILEKLKNKEPFLLRDIVDNNEYCEAYFYPKAKIHCRASELVYVAKYYVRKRWLIDDE